ncbi:hypothetical protein [Rossellomorea vietnamensis]|uniref:Uncharacterized protein n=1 Tax=Rossellomorea vietnamensis TaxID=218284 RepID=A0A0P6WC52_9BACI|nr:hypothetical protein [Rossellomorea vietnamensis]KPL58484.1 hypothetical protein AM506_16670 [Rossellomorea vietnamensis]
MSKDNLTLVIILGILSTIAGFIMLFFNVYFGTASAETWLINKGSGGQHYNVIVKGYINTFLVGGSILFVMGVLAIVLGYHQLQLKKGIESQLDESS